MTPLPDFCAFASSFIPRTKSGLPSSTLQTKTSSTYFKPTYCPAHLSSEYPTTVRNQSSPPTPLPFPPSAPSSEPKHGNKRIKKPSSPNLRSIYENQLDPNPRPENPKQVPHHSRLPIIGYVLDKSLDAKHGYTSKQRYGPIYTTTFLHPTKKVTVLASRHHVLTVLRERGELFKMAGAYPQAVQDILSSRLTADGEVHMKNKALTRLPFKMEGGDGIFEKVKEVFEKAWDCFVADEEEGKIKVEKRYKTMADKMEDSTFRIIVGITLGWDALKDESKIDISVMRHLFAKVVRAWFAPKLPFNLGWYGDGIRAKDELIEVTKVVVSERAKSHSNVIAEMKSIFENDASGKKSTVFAGERIAEGKADFVSLLLAMFGSNEQGLYEVAQIVMGFWFAGTETAANLITSGVNELGKRPELLERLTKEQNDFRNGTEQNGTGKSTFSLDGLESMPLLDAFFRECSRLVGPTSDAFRRVAKDVSIAGHAIEKGSLIICDLKAAMCDEDLFPDPTKFDIDRYLKSNSESEQMISMRKQAALFGFGGGQHFCTGAMLAKLEFKMAIALLLQSYMFEIDPRASTEYSTAVIYTPKSKVPLLLRRKSMDPTMPPKVDRTVMRP